jgi:hypothetical protein
MVGWQPGRGCSEDISDAFSSGLFRNAQFQAGYMHKIDNLSRTALIGYSDGAPSWHNPHEIRMRDVEPPLIREIDRESFEGSLLSRSPHLFRCHIWSIIEFLDKVQPNSSYPKADVLAQVSAARICSKVGWAMD